MKSPFRWRAVAIRSMAVAGAVASVTVPGRPRDRWDRERRDARAQITDDDISLVWLSSQNQNLTDGGVNALLQSQQSGNPANIQTVLHGPALQAQFGNPATDPRTPDIVIEPIPGTIYSKSGAKVAEHGGFAEDDTHVALLTVNGADVFNGTHVGGTVTQAVRTYQVAPTILANLGLNPGKLDSVRIENVQVLPGTP